MCKIGRGCTLVLFVLAWAAPAWSYDLVLTHATYWVGPGANALSILFQDGSTVVVNGPEVVNTGLLELGGYTGGNGWSTMRLDTACTFSNSGSVVLNAGNLTGQTFTNAAAHTISGYGGNIYAPVDNAGMIHANAPGSLTLLASVKTNSGTIKASSGGSVDVYVPINQSGGGRILADGSSSRIRLYNGTAITGGQTDTVNSGRFESTTSAISLADITNTGSWLIQDGATAAVTGTTFTNNGTIENGGYMGGSGSPTLRFDANVNLAGTGDLRLTGGYVSTGTGATFTNAASHTIHGYGRIYAAMTNNGLIDSDAGSAVYLSTNSKTNNGTIKASNGSDVYLSISINQSAAGQIVADGSDSRIYLQAGGRISSGKTRTANGGKFSVSGNTATISGITNEGNWLAEDGAYLRVSAGTIVNSGVFEVGGYTGGSGWAHLQMNGHAEFAGGGSIKLAPGWIDSTGAWTLTNGYGHTIRGYGDVNVPLVNHGTIRSESYTLTVTCQGTGITSDGTIDVPASTTMDLNNASLFAQTDGATIVNGILNVNGAALNLQGGTLKGSGTINGSVSNAGATVAPGNSPATLTINGDYAQAASGRMTVELAGLAPGEFDALAVSGTADLAGELQIEVFPPFVPQPGDEFVIVTAGTVTGSFAPVTGSGEFEVIGAPGSVTVRVVSFHIPADVDGDDHVDVVDLLWLVAAFGSMLGDPGYDPNCDFNSDGSIDVVDLLILVEWWGV